MAQQHLPYAGYTITVLSPANSLITEGMGDLTDVDEKASDARYQEHLAIALGGRFPGAEVIVRHDPHTIETRWLIEAPAQNLYEDSDSGDTNAGELGEVRAIMDNVFSEGFWYVFTPEGRSC